jgi:hypothetical protein
VQDLVDFLDALARAQLMARRVGATIEVHNAPPALDRLVRDAGLGCVLRVEVQRQVEEREQLSVDEEVDPGDRAV